MQTRDPKEALTLTEEILKYLYAIEEISMLIVLSDDEIVESSADGSYAGGDWSRTRVVVWFRDVVVNWASRRQSMTHVAMSFGVGGDLL